MYTDQQICDALREANGFVSQAAEALGCSLQTIYSRLETSEAVKAVRDAINESHLDHAETRLFDAIDRGEPWAIKFFLAYKGKSRGYQDSKKIEFKPSREQAATRIPDEQLDRMLEEGRRKTIDIPASEVKVVEALPATKEE